MRQYDVEVTECAAFRVGTFRDELTVLLVGVPAEYRAEVEAGTDVSITTQCPLDITRVAPGYDFRQVLGAQRNRAETEGTDSIK